MELFRFADLIENASDWSLDAHTIFCPRHFRSSLATSRDLYDETLTNCGNLGPIALFDAIRWV
jgi:hypothetical protein